MGLDMYFDKVRRVEGYTPKQLLNACYYFDAPPKEAEEDLGLSAQDIAKLRELDVRATEVAYFRKFNALHQWMVNHVQDGIDDGKGYEVSDNDLDLLVDTLKQVLESCKLVDYKSVDYQLPPEIREEIDDIVKNSNQPYLLVKNIDTAKDLLPTSEGFFFGSTLYDSYYVADVEEAYEIFSSLNLDEDMLIYTADW